MSPTSTSSPALDTRIGDLGRSVLVRTVTGVIFVCVGWLLATRGTEEIARHSW